jgi:hypothetical protein
MSLGGKAPRIQLAIQFQNISPLFKYSNTVLDKTSRISLILFIIKYTTKYCGDPRVGNCPMQQKKMHIHEEEGVLK